MHLTPAAHGGAYYQPTNTLPVGNAIETNSTPLPQGNQPPYSVGQGAIRGPNMPNPVSVCNTMPTDSVLPWDCQSQYTVGQGVLVNENMTNPRLITNATVTHL
jgi:hypothetical protein